MVDLAPWSRFSVSRWRLLTLLAATPVLLLLALAAFPWGYVAPRAAGPLSRLLGRTVTIAGAHRLDHLSLVPTVVLTGVRIGQPAWAGTGPMAQIAEVRVRFAALPALLGKFRPHSLDLLGARIELRRDANGRGNWESGARDHKHGAPPRIEHLAIADSRLHLIDRRGQIELAGSIRANARDGLVIETAGTQRGRPLTIAIRGAKLDALDPNHDYPVIVHAKSPLVTLDAEAMLDHPLDLGGFDARLSASGRDVTYLDDLIQAGLPPTQAFALTATVRRDTPDWRIERLDGTIGRSQLHAALSVKRRDGRTRLDGTVTAATLDFADFASDAQQARGAAKARAAGKRIIPDTRIRLDHLALLDGRVRLDVARLLGAAPFGTLHTVVALDRRRLVLAPLAADMAVGRTTGTIVVDHRGAIPQLAMAVRVASTIQAVILPRGEVQGPLAAHLVLHGPGSTFREAVGRSSGTVGLVVSRGSVRRDYATYLGGNVLKSIGALIDGGGAEARAPLRCLIGNFHASGGTLVPAPLVLDNAISRGDGRGRITLADERIDLVFTGRPKRPGPLLSTTPTRLFGTFADPQVDIRPPRADQARRAGLFDRIGAFVKGLRTKGDAGRSRPAPDVDCAGLARAALR